MAPPTYTHTQPASHTLGRLRTVGQAPHGPAVRLCLLAGSLFPPCKTSLPISTSCSSLAQPLASHPSHQQQLTYLPSFPCRVSPSMHQFSCCQRPTGITSLPCSFPAYSAALLAHASFGSRHHHQLLLLQLVCCPPTWMLPFYGYKGPLEKKKRGWPIEGEEKQKERKKKAESREKGGSLSFF